MSRYPPFDPFNTTYIPLPGVSDPRFALPLSSGNPHSFPARPASRFPRFLSHRPARHSNSLHHQELFRQ